MIGGALFSAPKGALSIWETGGFCCGCSEPLKKSIARRRAPSTITTTLMPTSRDLNRDPILLMKALGGGAVSFLSDAAAAGRAAGWPACSLVTAWAARRAAATKLARTDGSVSADAAGTPPAVASEAAMRSMALAMARIRRPPEPGSSGASGGRSDTIGGRGWGAGADGLVGTGVSAAGMARRSRNGTGAAAGTGTSDAGVETGRATDGARIAGGAAAAGRSLPWRSSSMVARRSTTCSMVP